MDLALHGKRVLVSGAGAGIGLAIAEVFAQEGCSVSICSRTPATVAAAGERIATRLAAAATVHTQVADMAQGNAVRSWVESAAQALGGIDVLVHNASGGGGAGEEAWRRNIDVDVLGFAHFVEHATPHLERSASASVVALGSTAAVEAFGNPAAPFGAMKAALIHQCAGLAKTLAPQGIRVNAVSPGPILVEGGVWEKVQAERPEYVEQVVAQIPSGRMGTAEEVARVVAFVASPAASLLTGANIVADGGLTKRIPI
ncbi:SDR family NAD(P)-dependent oxidoreductase [Nocardia rhamnosiphila]|uniref:SDR family oxidoreductase n=1 Tax=Nocardia rhamnosiphila TaxID=426716 RepID=A0ABV2WYQ0_9NOCA